MNRHLTPNEIDALLLGTATEIERREWEEHLKGCASCRGAMEAQEALFDAIRKGTVVPPAPVALEERISAGLSRSRSEERSGVAGLPPAVPWNRGWAWTAALVALAFGAGFWLGRSPVGESRETGDTRAEVAESMTSSASVRSLEGQSASMFPGTGRVRGSVPGREVADASGATSALMSSEDGSTQMTLPQRSSVTLPIHQSDGDTQSTLGSGWHAPS